MKTAILISGKINSGFKKSFDSINQYFIQPLNADVFISTWESKYLDETLRLYNPIFCRSENFDNANIKMRTNNFISFLNSINFDIKEQMIISCYPMFYKIYDAGVLMKDYEMIKNFKYDLVVRLRFDLFFDLILNNNELIDVLENDVLYLRKDSFTGKLKKYDEWIWDSFAFGNNKVMNIYCNTFLNYEKMILSNKPSMDINEMILLTNLKENGVILKQTKIIYAFNRNTE